MANQKNYESRVVLPIFRAAAVSWAAAKYQAVETELPTARAAEAVKGAIEERAVADRQRAFVFPKILFCPSSGTSADTVRAALCSALDASAGDATALRWDAAAISGGLSIKDVLTRKLWPRAKPRRIAQLWTDIKQGLLAANDDWGVWTDWYEARLRGKASSEALEAARLMIKNDIWEQGPAVVNSEFKKFAGHGSTRRRRKARVSLPAPEVPPPRVAALEPFWRSGKLVLPRNSAESDRQSVVMAVSFKLLRAEITALADDAACDPTIRRRAIVCLRSVAARIPGCTPPQNELFYLAHVKGFLRDYAKIFQAGWQDLFAKRIAEAILHFDHMVQQFPKWRDFVGNAEKDPLTLEEAAEIPALANVMVAVLCEDEARNLIDPAIASALEVFQAPLQWDMSRREQQLTGPGEASKLLLANDLFLSIENITKRIADAVLETKYSPGPDEQTGLASDTLSFSDKDGGPAYIWMTRTLLKIMASAPTLALHSKFCWLEPFLSLVDPEGRNFP